MNYRHICTAAMVAHHDLLVTHEALEATDALGMRHVLLRHLILEIANVADLAAISGGMYKDNPELGALHSKHRKGLEFFKYLRNVYVGHFVPDLTEKTFEWMPQTNMAIGGADLNRQWMVSWFALETAINTYAVPETGHKILESDTDLNYPPDLTRFLNFTGETAVGAIAYSAQLIQVSRSHIEVPDNEAELLELVLKAGGTTFAVLTKGRR